MRKKRIGKQEFFARALSLQAERSQLLRFFSCQSVFFFSKRWSKANDRDGSLDVAGAFDASVLVRRDAHGAAGERPKGIDRAVSVCAERGAGQVLELFGQLLGKKVWPVIEHRRHS